MSYAPRRYKRGKSVDRLRAELSRMLRADAALFASGRESLLALLRAINLRSGEEVIVQGYTCIVVPNAIHAAGGVPIYADIDRETLNLDIEAVRAAITPRTRAIICQHTFGIPADTQALRSLCDEHSIFLVEDCAHIIPDECGPAGLGTLGDFILLSFGRDKAVSGITGGAMLSRKPEITARLKAIENEAADLSWWTIAKLLHYPVRMRSAIRPLYSSGLAGVYMRIVHAFGFFIPIVTPEEKAGRMSPLLHRIPNACAFLARKQLKRLQSINDHRRELTRYYLRCGKQCDWPMLRAVHGCLPLQKFPLFVRDARRIRKELRKHNIHLDDGWTGCVICPEGVDMSETDYHQGSDPEAEAAREQILSLPTHPTMTMKQARKLAVTLNEKLSKAMYGEDQ